MNIAVVTDNIYLKKSLADLVHLKNLPATFTFWSYSNELIQAFDDVKKIDVKNDWHLLLEFDLVLSLHCKQLFPEELVRQKKCINVHPGFNPYNRGWFPQVFSIINKLPAGATIHEIDCELDHGPVIAQKEIEVHAWDTSLSIYNRVLEAELELLDLYLEKIIDNNYTAAMPSFEGNLNLKKDFNKLCEIDLNEKATYGEVIDRLRALSHGDYNNAFFYDRENGKKIFAHIHLIEDN